MASVGEMVHAARAGDLSALSAALREGGDPHALDEGSGHSAITSAAHHGQVGSTRVLVAHGADPARRDERGLHAVDRAASEGHTHIIPELLARHDVKGGIKIARSKGSDGLTPLHRAISGNQARHISTMLELVRRGGDVNDPIKEGLSTLMLASLLGNVGMAEALINHGADVNAQDGQGFTALHHAAMQGHTKVVQVLMNANANINIKDELDQTPAAAARVQGRMEVVAALTRPAPVPNSPKEVEQKRSEVEQKSLASMPHLRKELEEKAQQAEFIRAKAREAEHRGGCPRGLCCKEFEAVVRAEVQG